MRLTPQFEPRRRVRAVEAMQTEKPVEGIHFDLQTTTRVLNERYREYEPTVTKRYLFGPYLLAMQAALPAEAFEEFLSHAPVEIDPKQEMADGRRLAKQPYSADINVKRLAEIKLFAPGFPLDTSILQGMKDLSYAGVVAAGYLRNGIGNQFSLAVLMCYVAPQIRPKLMDTIEKHKQEFLTRAENDDPMLAAGLRLLDPNITPDLQPLIEERWTAWQAKLDRYLDADWLGSIAPTFVRPKLSAAFYLATSMAILAAEEVGFDETGTLHLVPKSTPMSARVELPERLTA